MSENAWELVAARMADLRALQGAVTLLTWDQETYLPKAGAEARGEQLSALQGLYHEKLTAPELGDAIESAGQALRAEGQPDEAGPERAGGMGGTPQAAPPSRRTSRGTSRRA
jgi:Zn-dependent M32 family carboxypeptidase